MTRHTASLVITGHDLDFRDMAKAAAGGVPVTVASDAFAAIAASRGIVETILAENRPAYGITTGVGSQKDFAVDPAGAAAYNARLVAAHATRVPGPTLPPEAVRGAMIYLANQFANGLSGVSPELVELIVAAVNGGEMPEIDGSGSVGASDLVPNAQLSHWLLSRPQAKALGLPKPKETLSLINNNAVSLAQGAIALGSAERLLAAFDLAAAAALEGFRGNLGSISEAANRAHKRRGQRRAAERLRHLLGDSRLWKAGEARLLQDPLSFRCVSQVHGAAAEVFTEAAKVWNSELNSVNDNPIIDQETQGAVSNGNMDTTRLTLAADHLRQALGKMCDLAGERVHKQQWPAFTGLPTGLAEEAGAVGGVQFLNLGHITASLVTSVKIWARPSLLNSVGQVADGVEDTASHALHAVHDLMRVIDAGWKIAGLELMIAVWAMKRRRLRKADLGKGIRPAVEILGDMLPIGREGDTIFDIAPLIAELQSGALLDRALTEAQEKVDLALD
ncbi:MAG: aromatic amino acid lyase [Parvibaculaceae bacterium]